MIVIKRVSQPSEITGIKELQNRNLRLALTATEIEQEGFVTAEYTIAELEKMNALEPSIIAKEGEEVVGYALVINRRFQGVHPLVDDLFRQVDQASYDSQSLRETDYLLVGQLCVGRTHRRLGLSRKMYEFYREQLSPRYPFLITDVVESNVPSLRAHQRTGFEIIGTLEYGGSRWHIVLWNWRKQNPA